MQAGNLTQIPAACTMAPESVVAYVLSEQERGAMENALRRCKRFTMNGRCNTEGTESRI